jgi:hypothetical protein
MSSPHCFIRRFAPHWQNLSAKHKSQHQLRCDCATEPLLAVYGVDNGRLYIHVKVYKAKRLYAELVVTEGTVRIHCRICFRWHKIRIIQPGVAKLEVDRRPEFLGVGR